MPHERDADSWVNHDHFAKVSPETTMKKLLIAIAAIALVVLVFVAIAFIGGSPPDDDHLTPATYPPPSADNPLANGSDFLAETIALPSEFHSLGDPEIHLIVDRVEQNTDLARAIVDQNHHIIKIIDDALAVKDWTTGAKMNSVRLRDLSQLKRLQGIVAEADGSPHLGVLHDLEAGEIYSRLESRPRSLATFMLGLGGSGRVVSRGDFTNRLRMIGAAETLTIILGKLKATRHRPNVAQQCLKVEYQTYLTSLKGGGQALAQGYGLMGNLVQPDRASSEFAEFFTRAIDPLLPANARNDLTVPDPRPFSLNYAGQMLLQDCSTIVDLTLESWVKRHAQREALIVLAALRLYEIENGDLPESLSDLVPDYLDKAPLDSYDGQPLRYDATKAWIYSVGSDFIDAGGDESDGDFGSPTEPTLRLRNKATESGK